MDDLDDELAANVDSDIEIDDVATWRRGNHVAADVAGVDVSIFLEKWRQHIPVYNRPNLILGPNWDSYFGPCKFLVSAPLTFHPQPIFISAKAHIHFSHNPYTFQPNKILPTDSKQKS
jgi:hypothetical protein